MRNHLFQKILLAPFVLGLLLASIESVARAGDLESLEAKKILRLKDGETIPREVLERGNLRVLAEAILQRLNRNTEAAREGSAASVPYDFLKESEIQLAFKIADFESILKSGFLNLHQTSTTNGTGNIAGRVEAELALSGLSFEKGDHVSPAIEKAASALRPKHAYLDLTRPMYLGARPNYHDSSLAQYGDVIAVMSDEVKKRATWTDHDSLGTTREADGSAFGLGREKNRGTFFQRFLERHDSSSWNDYWEAQIWGPVDFRDVKYLMVPEGTSRESVEKLKKAGVPIFEYERRYPYYGRPRLISNRQLWAGPKSVNESAKASNVALTAPKKEFENYFLPPEYRGKELSIAELKAIPASKLKPMRGLLEDATASVLSHVTIPVVSVGEHGEEKTSEIRLYEYLSKRLSAAGKGKEILFDGGTVRSPIAYIYQKIRDEMQANPHASPEGVLRKIAKDKSPISYREVIAPGSDIDVALKGPKEWTDTAQSQARDLINGAMHHFGLDSIREFDLNRALVPVGDVKPYDFQIDRSVAQGGSTLDHLAFSVKSGKFIEPAHAHYEATIVDDFLRGLYTYAPPVNSTARTAPIETLIRGWNPLTEFPFIQLKDETEFRSEMEAFVTSLGKGYQPSDRELKQIKKIWKRARFGAGDNRFFKGPSDSVERKIGQALELIGSKNPERGPLRFVQSPTVAEKATLKLLPSELLLPTQEFIFRHTDRGKLYLPVTGVENAMSSIRSGVPAAAGNSTWAKEWTSARLASSETAAEALLKGEGAVVPLSLSQPSFVQVLDWERWERALKAKNPAVLEIVKKAQSQGVNPEEILKREYHVDFVIRDGSTYCVNSSEVARPQGSQGVVDLLKGVRIKEELPLETRIKNMEFQNNVSRFLTSSGYQAPVEQSAEASSKLASEVLVQAKKAYAESKAAKGASRGFGFAFSRTSDYFRYLGQGPIVRGAKAYLKEAILGSDVELQKIIAKDTFSQPMPSNDLIELMHLFIDRANPEAIRTLTWETFHHIDQIPEDVLVHFIQRYATIRTSSFSFWLAYSENLKIFL